MQVSNPDYLVAAEEGCSGRLGGATFAFKILGEHNRNAFSLSSLSLDPGYLMPPHVHSRDEEFLYVLDGELAVMVGDEEFPAPTGSCVILPRHIPHTVWKGELFVRR